MKPVIFLGYLCLLLLKGNNPVATGGLHNGISYTQGLQMGKIGQKSCADIDADYAIVENGDTDKKEEYLLCEDMEEDDSNDFSARKDKLFNNSDITGCSNFDLSNLRTRIKTLQPPYKLLFYTYATLRVLRV